MSRKKEIREMASLIGNSAAHIALLPDSEYAQKEATTYTEDAAETAAGRTWNEGEIADFIERAKNRAISELKIRIKKYGLPQKQIDIFSQRAKKYISAFAENHMEKS